MSKLATPLPPSHKALNSNTSATTAELGLPLAELIAIGPEKKFAPVLALQTTAQDYAYAEFGAIAEGHYTEF